MTEPNCENVCMVVMAIADGNSSELSTEHIEAHLASCSDCRREVEQLRALTGLLDSQQRRERMESVWPRVEQQLLADAVRARPASHTWYPLVLLGLLLLGYRIVEMVPDRDFGLLFKLVPILFVIAAFGYLRENPFKVNSDLRLEGE
ncbi:MAG: zf-HC2 domain-containing protein [Acidobacteriota bacterium]